MWYSYSMKLSKQYKVTDSGFFRTESDECSVIHGAIQAAIYGSCEDMTPEDQEIYWKYLETQPVARRSNWTGD